MVREKIFVFGASGHAKVVIDIIERQGEYAVAFLIDDDLSLKGKEIYGYPVRGGKDDLQRLRETEGVSAGIVAIGSNGARARVARWLTENGFRLVSAVHPSAQLARGVTIGAGTVVMAGAVINSDCAIGDNVIVNTRASVDHDCTIGNGVHLAPGVTLCGTVRVGEGTFVCAGATVIPNLTVGCNVTIGAGATVIRDAPEGVTLVGSPARIVRK
jgi:sugar O-acyltransferase (sialic acid O-acetyltransferase NeuD family)